MSKGLNSPASLIQAPTSGSRFLAALEGSLPLTASGQDCLGFTRALVVCGAKDTGVGALYRLTVEESDSLSSGYTVADSNTVFGFGGITLVEIDLAARKRYLRLKIAVESGSDANNVAFATMLLCNPSWKRVSQAAVVVRI